MLTDVLLIGQNDGGALVAGGLMLVVWVLMAIVGLGLWIAGLVSAIKNPALDDTMRIIWVFVIVLTGFVGAILYFLVGRGGQRTQAG